MAQVLHLPLRNKPNLIKKTFAFHNRSVSAAFVLPAPSFLATPSIVSLFQIRDLARLTSHLIYRANLCLEFWRGPLFVSSHTNSLQATTSGENYDAEIQDLFLAPRMTSGKWRGNRMFTTSHGDPVCGEGPSGSTRFCLQMTWAHPLMEFDPRPIEMKLCREFPAVQWLRPRSSSVGKSQVRSKSLHSSAGSHGPQNTCNSDIVTNSLKIILKMVLIIKKKKS